MFWGTETGKRGFLCMSLVEKNARSLDALRNPLQGKKSSRLSRRGYRGKRGKRSRLYQGKRRMINASSSFLRRERNKQRALLMLVVKSKEKGASPLTKQGKKMDRSLRIGPSNSKNNPFKKKKKRNALCAIKGGKKNKERRRGKQFITNLDDVNGKGKGKTKIDITHRKEKKERGSIAGRTEKQKRKRKEEAPTPPKWEKKMSVTHNLSRKKKKDEKDRLNGQNEGMEGRVVFVLWYNREGGEDDLWTRYAIFPSKYAREQTSRFASIRHVGKKKKKKGEKENRLASAKTSSSTAKGKKGEGLTPYKHKRQQGKEGGST